MKKALKWIILSLVTVVLLILIPIGINKLYETIRSSFLTDLEKRSEDVERLEYIFKNEFSGYNVLPASPHFDEHLIGLKKIIEDKTPISQEAFNLAIIKAVSSFKDPHTSVYNKRALLDQRFPFSLTWSDGDFYILSGKVDKQWLGAKVVKLGNASSQEVFDKLSVYTNSPNEAGSAYFINSFVSSVEVLYQEDIISNRNSIDMEMSLEGKKSTITFNSLPNNEISMLADYLRMSDKVGDQDLPLYKNNPQKNYWYEFNESENLLYLRYSLCAAQGDIDSFWKEVFKKIGEIKPGKFVIDVRGNPGGDTQNHSSFLSRIQSDTIVNKYGKLFTLIDRGTGSAAVSFASDMERLTETILVGEKTMDTPNTTSDPTFFTLPHSKITVLVPNLYSLHSHLHDKRNGVIPHLPITQNIQGESYFHDEVMDSIRRINLTDNTENFAKLPSEAAGQYTFSAIRNLSLMQQDSIWYVSIDGLIESPIYQQDSLLYTRIYGLNLVLKDTVGKELFLQVNNSKLNLKRISDQEKSLEQLILYGKYEMAKNKLKDLLVNNEIPYFLDRPYFQSRTYAAYNQEGFKKAYELNQLTKEFYPYDPVVSIIDFELYQYEGKSLGQIKSIFPVIGKVLKRYYTVITTDKIMNDKYNAFIGK